MNIILRAVQSHTRHAFGTLHRALSNFTHYDPDRVYLEGATDIYDLEHRMQVVEFNHCGEDAHRWHVSRL
ncbi:MAG: hypothetical protein KGQ46_01790 [Hyphomicrobiales bacterium]|nr:hypothetical protein [Hyphomicrobiales bacterium]